MNGLPRLRIAQDQIPGIFNPSSLNMAPISLSNFYLAILFWHNMNSGGGANKSGLKRFYSSRWGGLLFQGNKELERFSLLL